LLADFDWCGTHRRERDADEMENGHIPVLEGNMVVFYTRRNEPFLKKKHTTENGTVLTKYSLFE
jgi:hypothetical protein